MMPDLSDYEGGTMTLTTKADYAIGRVLTPHDLAATPPNEALFVLWERDGLASLLADPATLKTTCVSYSAGGRYIRGESVLTEYHTDKGRGYYWARRCITWTTSGSGRHIIEGGSLRRLTPLCPCRKEEP